MKNKAKTGWTLVRIIEKLLQLLNFSNQKFYTQIVLRYFSELHALKTNGRTD